MKKNALVKTILPITGLVGIALMLGLFTTSRYLNMDGFDFQMSYQLNRIQAVLAGHAGNPWQYRVLAPILVNEVIKLFENFHIPHDFVASFIFFRVVEDTFILLLSYVYYRKLGLSLPNALIGMAVLAWGISYSFYDSDLSFNTFFDIIFYLLAGLCILKGKYIWIIPITLFAAFNRETSVLIPFLLLVSIFILQKTSLRKVIPIFSIAFVTFVVIFVSLRLLYGRQELILPYGHHPGLDLLQYNLFHLNTWQQLVATLSIIPIIAIIGYQKWPPQLRVFFWVIAPIWFIVHVLFAVMAEGRLFLVPQTMIFIPGALLSLSQQTPPLELDSLPKQIIP
jgi:hypothetical protein